MHAIAHGGVRTRVRASALKVDSGRKIPCRTGESNLRQRRDGPMLKSTELHSHHHLFLNREGRWGTTDDFTTSFLHFPLFFTALWDLANSRPVHSLMLTVLYSVHEPALLLVIWSLEFETGTEQFGMRDSS